MRVTYVATSDVRLRPSKRRSFTNCSTIAEGSMGLQLRPGDRKRKHNGTALIARQYWPVYSVGDEFGYEWFLKAKSIRHGC